MAHLKALGIKVCFTLPILLLFTLFESATFGQILLITIILTSISYLIVDLFLLPTFGFISAAILDFGLAFFTVWFISTGFIGQSPAVVIVSLFVACLFTLCERTFHKYMKNIVLRKKQAVIIPFPNMDYQTQTEASEDIFPNKDNRE